MSERTVEIRRLLEEDVVDAADIDWLITEVERLTADNALFRDERDDHPDVGFRKGVMQERLRTAAIFDGDGHHMISRAWAAAAIRAEKRKDNQ